MAVIPFRPRGTTTIGEAVKKAGGRIISEADLDKLEIPKSQPTEKTKEITRTVAKGNKNTYSVKARSPEGKVTVLRKGLSASDANRQAQGLQKMRDEDSTEVGHGWKYFAERDE
jgi:hypothetical protein